MIYGATGYTGVLLAEEAARRGQRPVLAGRSAQKLQPLAERLGLDWVAADLRDVQALTRAVGQVGLVLHAAGPFTHTADPMLRACLAAGAHYLDITGELPVFRQTFGYDAVARRRKVALISGVGFDVVPTDCMALYVATRTPGATELELAIAAEIQISAGTAKSALEMAPSSGYVRRDGRLTPLSPGVGARRVRFSHRELSAMPIPWGDLETAYRSTGIPNITTLLATPEPVITFTRLTWPLTRQFMAVQPIRQLMQQVATQFMRGPDEATRATARAYIWARAADERGNATQAWLETPEAYHFTSLAGLRCVERLLKTPCEGALTPAQAFGADLVLEIEGVRRLDGVKG
jgi:short subunit dehydrogenase-like uncharacterized protein